MAYALPNGSTFDIAGTIAASKTFTAITNAAAPLVTSVAHGLVTGDYIVVNSGWTKLNNRVFRVTSGTVDNFTLQGVDTSSISLFQPGLGIGSFQKILTWVNIPQITEVAFSGGEQQFLSFAFLEDVDEKQMPTSKSAISMSLTVADDPALAYVPVVEAADVDLKPRPLKLNLVSGSVMAYYAITSITATPTVTRDELMSRVITLSLQGRPTRL